jgi:hypothetical protein
MVSNTIRQLGTYFVGKKQKLTENSSLDKAVA